MFGKRQLRVLRRPVEPNIMWADRAGRSGRGISWKADNKCGEPEVATNSFACIFWPQSRRNFAVATCSIDATR